MQFYNRTCDKVFGYAFEECLNHADALLVCREAFIDMYFDISSLRRAPGVDFWQRKQVNKSIRYLVRRDRLSLLHEKSAADIPDSLTADEKEELWRRINRTIDIDPWRLVPVPGKSSGLTVLLDQIASDFSYMSLFDIARTAGLALLVLALAGGGVFGGYYLISHGGLGGSEAYEEIFLDERSYTQYNEESKVRVSEEEIRALIKDAFGGLEDEGGLSGSVSAARNSAGNPVYTNSDEINRQLRAIVEESVTNEMTDDERLWALYHYVGTHLRYDRVSGRSEDSLALLRHAFKEQTGDSRHYAALTCALFRAAGYECEVIRGRFVLNAETEFSRDVPHDWNRMRLNGMYYYFDCEADSDAFGTQVRQYYFMATDGNARWSVWNRDHQGGTVLEQK